jgi:hypothetical protein
MVELVDHVRFRRTDAARTRRNSLAQLIAQHQHLRREKTCSSSSNSASDSGLAKATRLPIRMSN